MRLRLAIGLSLALLGIVLASGGGHAAPDEGSAPAPAEPARRFCTPTGCGPRPATPLATAGAFGAAVLLAGLAARRSPPPRS